VERTEDVSVIETIFTTRGDVFHNQLAKKLGAKIDPEGQVEVNQCMRPNVPRLYAAGCVTRATAR
jgi:thioredoxin reductase